MAQFSFTSLLLVALVASVQSFTSPMRPTVATKLFAEDQNDSRPLADGFFERGVSVDQDGKSNVWAIEPKVEIDSKSSEEKGQIALIAGGGLAATLAFAAVVLTNLPDPNQF